MESNVMSRNEFVCPYCNAVIESEFSMVCPFCGKVPKRHFHHIKMKIEDYFLYFVCIFLIPYFGPFLSIILLLNKLLYHRFRKQIYALMTVSFLGIFVNYFMWNYVFEIL